MTFLKALLPNISTNYNPVINYALLADSTTYSTTESLNTIRDLIGITNSAYDFGLQTALVSLNAYPELLKEVNEENLIGLIASYAKPDITIDSGKLLPIGNQFSLSFRPYRVFKTLTLNITYLNGTQVKLNIDGDAFICNYEVNHNFLKLHLPVELNELKFGIQLPQTWSDGHQINIGLVPNGYPFKDVTSKLNESLEFISTCNKHGLLDTFISMPELPYKIAIATLVVYKEQLRLNNG